MISERIGRVLNDFLSRATPDEWKRMKKNNLKVVRIDKNKSLFNYEKKVLIKDLIRPNLKFTKFHEVFDDRTIFI